MAALLASTGSRGSVGARSGSLYARLSKGFSLCNEFSEGVLFRYHMYRGRKSVR